MEANCRKMIFGRWRRSSRVIFIVGNGSFVYRFDVRPARGVIAADLFASGIVAIGKTP